MTKTYEQRLAEIAEELMECSYNLVAKEDGNKQTYAEFKHTKGDEYMEAKTFLILPLAAIALKHSAEAYAEGHEQGTAYPHIDINLTSLGLIPPQKP